MRETCSRVPPGTIACWRQVLLKKQIKKERRCDSTNFSDQPCPAALPTPGQPAQRRAAMDPMDVDVAALVPHGLPPKSQSSNRIEDMDRPLVFTGVLDCFTYLGYKKYSRLTEYPSTRLCDCSASTALYIRSPTRAAGPSRAGQGYSVVDTWVLFWFRENV